MLYRKHLRLVWVVAPQKVKRRTLKDIENYVSPDKILLMIKEGRAWPYKTRKEFYKKRDRALLVTLYLTASRISETLLLKKDQFNFSDPEFVVVEDFKILKRKKKTLQKEGRPMVNIPFPKVGVLKPFTEMVLDYLPFSSNRLFPFTRHRAHQLVKYQTGMWPHYFRSQRLSQVINLIKNPDAVGKMFGIKSTNTLTHYYKTSWEEHKNAFLQ